ncbi:MAG: UDP-N-acetylmuramate dehydrogenase [Pirellulales bacterium]|jgi:UDP-N-acetylmuramate dehydrogenase|nr:UDP-N-acetylmuramate dehydrogenase [Pirellulales bacterium]
MSLITGFEDFVQQDVPLAEKTWFKVGGAAEYFAQPQSLEHLTDLVKRCHEEGVAVRLLGGGSNVLVRDDGVAGMVIRLTGEPFEKIEVDGDVVHAAGAARLGHVLSSAVREGLSGLETLVGIPGTIGGALHGNAGARGGDIGQWTARATVMTRSGEMIQREREELDFGYRQSSLDELAILSADFKLEREDPEALTKRMQQQWIVKKAGLPLAHQATGCIFKNPRGMSAAMLIEQAGMKAASTGKVLVSDRHANYIVAEEGAKAADVLKLIENIRESVAERLGIELELELEIW